MDHDVNIPYHDEKVQVLPSAAPFPEQETPFGNRNLSGEGLFIRGDPELPESAEAAQMRRPRGRRVIQPDQSQELPHSVLRDWQNNYLANMVEVKRLRQHNQLPALAKKNAWNWTWGFGIGGVGKGLSGLSLPTPLTQFAGESLRDMILGIPRSPDSRKRDRSTSPSEENERRVRPRSDNEEQIGRGAGSSLDDGGLPQLHDEVSNIILPQEELDLHVTGY